jgi:hypothetical protein
MNQENPFDALAGATIAEQAAGLARNLREFHEDRTRVARLAARLVELEEDNRRISLAYDLMREGVAHLIRERDAARGLARDFFRDRGEVESEVVVAHPWLAE